MLLPLYHSLFYHNTSYIDLWMRTHIYQPVTVCTTLFLPFHLCLMQCMIRCYIQHKLHYNCYVGVLLLILQHGVFTVHFSPLGLPTYVAILLGAMATINYIIMLIEAVAFNTASRCVTMDVVDAGPNSICRPPSHSLKKCTISTISHLRWCLGIKNLISTTTLWQINASASWMWITLL